MLSLGARKLTSDQAVALVEIFCSTPFSGEPRHLRRIRLLAGYEAARGAGTQS